jgi:hypothetical protein
MVQKIDNIPDEVYIEKMLTDLQPVIKDNLTELYFHMYNSVAESEGNISQVLDSKSFWDGYSMACMDVYNKLYGEVLPVVATEHPTEVEKGIPF